MGAMQGYFSPLAAPPKATFFWSYIAYEEFAGLGLQPIQNDGVLRR